MNTVQHARNEKIEKPNLPKLYWAYCYKNGSVQVKQYRKGNDVVVQAAKKNSSVVKVIEPYIAINDSEAWRLAYSKFGVKPPPPKTVLRANGKRDLETIHSIKTHSLEVLMFPLAGWLDRIVARSIDLLITCLPLAVAFWLSMDGVWPQAFSLYILLGTGLLAFMYFLLADGFSMGQSIGKRVVRLAVVRVASKAPCDFRRSIARNICLLLGPMDWLFNFGPKKRRLGDRLAKTMVVRRIDFRKALIGKADIIQIDS